LDVAKTSCFSNLFEQTRNYDAISVDVRWVNIQQCRPIGTLKLYNFKEKDEKVNGISLITFGCFVCSLNKMSSSNKGIIFAELTTEGFFRLIFLSTFQFS
jgi:hypothetical protein